MPEEEQPTTSEAPDAEAQDAADLEGGSPPEETAEAEDQATPDADAGDGEEAEADDEAEDAPDLEGESAPEVTAEAEDQPTPDADAAGGDDEERESDPAVQEYIGQDTTVVHHADEPEHGVPTTFRTPPGIPGGLDPKTLGDRDRGPVPPEPDTD